VFGGSQLKFEEICGLKTRILLGGKEGSREGDEGRKRPNRRGRVFQEIGEDGRKFAKNLPK